MGNTDTLHPNSCFCSFSIPTSENTIFVTSVYSFYAHAHETTPTSGYKLSHTHIVVQEGGGMQEWVIQIPSIQILVSVLFPSLHLKYFRIKFLLLIQYNTYVCASVCVHVCTYNVHFT